MAKLRTHSSRHSSSSAHSLRARRLTRENLATSLPLLGEGSLLSYQRWHHGFWHTWKSRSHVYIQCLCCEAFNEGMHATRACNEGPVFIVGINKK